MNNGDMKNKFPFHPKIFLVIDRETGKTVAMHYSLANAMTAARWHSLKDFRIEER